MSMVTDTKRILRTDPGRPEVCNVCQLHRFFGPDWEEIQDGERTARTGCVDTKKLLADRIVATTGPRVSAISSCWPIPTTSTGSWRPAPTDCVRAPRRRWTRSATRWACADGHAERPPRRTRPPTRRRAPRAGRHRVFFLVVEQVATVFFYFGDILLTFFLAWLLAFIISPVVTRIVDAVPRLPRAVAAVLVYTLVVVLMALSGGRRRRRMAHLDRPVRRVDPEHPGQPADDRRPVAAVADLDRARPDRPGGQSACVLDNLDKTRASSSRPAHSRWPAWAPSGRC